MHPSQPLNPLNISLHVFDVNTTDAPSVESKEPPYAPWQAFLLILSCSVVIVGTIIGNILVCTAVALVRKLRTPSNLLIVSLAVSDLLVAALVMSLAATYEVMGEWVLGPTVCDAFTSLDVLLCTASILNLCAISIDRYFVITRPFRYAMKRTPARMAAMIVFVWMLSALISIPPLFGWKGKSAAAIAEAAEANQCAVSQDIGYQIYATIGAFYLPMFVMIVIYTRIYMVSSRIALTECRATAGIQPNNAALANERKNNKDFLAPPAERALLNPPSKDDQISVTNHSLDIASSNKDLKDLNDDLAPSLNLLIPSNTNGTSLCNKRFKLFKKSRLNRIASSNERKATKTLGVIMGAFTACWLPFFILALIKPFCSEPDTCIPHWLNSFLLWLGYANSFLNPLIYARFNRDFRTPFKEILLCRCRDINLRLRTESYAEQFGPAGVKATHSNSRPSVDTVVKYNCNHGYTYVKVGCHDAETGAKNNCQEAVRNDCPDY